MSYEPERMKELFYSRKYDIGDVVYHHHLYSDAVNVDRINGIDMSIYEDIGVGYILGYNNHLTSEKSISTDPIEALKKYEEFVRGLSLSQRIKRKKALFISNIKSSQVYQRFIFNNKYA